jgi:DNA modification methylase
MTNTTVETSRNAYKKISESGTKQTQKQKVKQGLKAMGGDATNEEHVKTLMNGEKTDIVFTDPPYGIEFQSNHRENQFEELKNDDKILDFTDKLEKFAKNKSHRYICTGHQVYNIWRKMFNNQYKSTLIWKKNNTGMGDLENDYAPLYEMILFCNPENTSLNGKREPNVWEVDIDDVNSYQHPTQKPVELPARAIKNSSKQDDIVLDLFAGSGPTLLAAEQTNRKAYCMELDPQYCQVIINRWEELTDKKADPVK